MDEKDMHHCTAFEGNRRVASGNLMQVAGKVKEMMNGDQTSVLIFDDLTSEVIEVDFRGSIKDVLKRLEKPAPIPEPVNGPLHAEQGSQRGPGRPKLGVVSREVTLLPRHWDWLNSQPGGASVALRKLVEEARRANGNRDKVRHSQEAAYRFMSAMAGNMPGFEEATRALFAGNRGRFNDLVASWPVDIRDHSQKLSDPAFQNQEQGT